MSTILLLDLTKRIVLTHYTIYIPLDPIRYIFPTSTAFMYCIHNLNMKTQCAHNKYQTWKTAFIWMSFKVRDT